MSQTLKDIIIISLITSIFFGFMLGSRNFSTPDEARYVEIPREMIVTGDFITPRLDGVKYFEKPPLFYWLEALMIKSFGINEWATRIVPAFFGIIGCGLVYVVGLTLWGRVSGSCSAMVLATNLLYYVHTRIIILDLVLSIFISIALLSFCLALNSTNIRQKVCLSFFFIGCAGAVLTKGLIGVVIPGGTIFIWVIFFKRWHVLKLAFSWWGIILFLLLVAPWHVIVSLKNPTFFDFYFIHEHFTRFLTSVHRRTAPFLFFVPVVFIGMFPWVSFLYQSISRVFKDRDITYREEMYLIIWIVFTFIFFSLGNSKLIPYILPIFPALALLIGKYIANIWTTNSHDKLSIRGMYGYMIFCGVIAIGLWVLLYDFELLEAIFIKFAIAITIFMCCSSFVIYQLMNDPRKQIIAIALNTCILFIAINAISVRIYNFEIGRSIKQITLEIKKHIKPGDEVISYQKYYHDLPLYMNRIVKVVNKLGELKHGAESEDCSEWIIDNVKFQDLWLSDKTVFAVMKKGDYQSLVASFPNVYLLMQTNMNFLAVNKDLRKQ